jgi:hypothetical protein
MIVLILILSLLSSSLAVGHDDVHHRHYHRSERERVDGETVVLAPVQSLRELDNSGEQDELQGDDYRLALSGSLGNYFGVQRIDALRVPLFVNVIFLGFDGDGESQARLDGEDLSGWFSHVEHSMSHRQVPVGEEQTTVLSRRTDESLVGYDVQLNVVKLTAMINTIVEDVLLWSARADRGFERDRQGRKVSYVSSYHLASVLGSLVERLGLDEQSYTLFVMNPKSPVQRGQSYGYRAGFSRHELAKLYKSQVYSVQRDISRAKNPSAAGAKRPQPAAGDDKKLASGRLTRTDLRSASEAWAQDYVRDVIGQLGHFEQGADLDVSGDEESPLLVYRRPIDWQDSIEVLAAELAANGTTHEREYLRRAQRDPEMRADCIVDAWVSHRRFAWLDLTAGPFEWGPSVAAEGVRSFGTLPRVPKALGGGAKKRSRAREDRSSLDAQIDYTMQLLGAYCRTLRDSSKPRSYCTELSLRVTSLREQRSALALDNADGDEQSGDAASDVGEALDLAGGLDEGADADAAMDRFAAHLAATVSSALRHLVAPPTPLFAATYFDRITFHLYVVSNHDDAAYTSEAPWTFNYDRWKRELLALKLPQQEFVFVRKGVSMADDAELGVAFASSLRGATLAELSPHGDYSRVDQSYVDSKALQRRLRTVASVRDGLAAPLDSDAGPEPAWQAERVVRSRHLPIFLFSLGGDEPLLIDRYYQAKALSDMIVVVQSAERNYTSRLQCNGRSIALNLRDPVKPALAAAAVHLGGLVPPHIDYSEARKAATQQWLWSVGDSPFSHTCESGAHFNAFQRDISHRNYIVHSLNETAALVNAAADRLHAAQPTDSTLDTLRQLNARATVLLYQESIALYVRILDALGQLDFAAAAAHLPRLHIAARLFASQTSTLVDQLVQNQCATIDLSVRFVDSGASAPQDIAVELSSLYWSSFALPLFFVADLVLIALFLLRRQRNANQKIKVN